MTSGYQQGLLRLLKSKTVEVRYGWRGKVTAIHQFDRVPMKGEKIEIKGEKYTVKEVLWADSLGSERFMASVLLK